MIISTRLQGSREFVDKLKLADKNLRQRKPMYKSLAIETHKWILENFRKSGALGEKWKPLSPLTIQSRRKRSSKPLLDTGKNLMQQWTYTYSNTRAIIGHPSDIATFHEYGTKAYVIRPKNKKMLWFGVTPDQRRKRKKGGIFKKEVNHPGLPARRMLPESKEIMPRLIKVVEFWLRKIIS